MRRSLAPSQRNKPHSILTQKQSNFNASPQSAPAVRKPNISSLSSPHQESLKTSDSSALNANRDGETPRSFTAVYGKPSKKKHKTWDGDGILEVDGKSAILKDNNGKVIGQTGNLKKCDLEDGTILFVGSKEVEISTEIFQKPCLSAPDGSIGSVKRKNSCFENPIASPVMKKDRKALGSCHAVPVSQSIVQTTNRSKSNTVYEPLIMAIPNDSHQWQCNPDNLPITPVSVEGFLCKVLRKHQREGVTFLYNCVTGLRDVQHTGAILADEMGLGKTLQCITLIWTCLKQGPYGNIPLAKKVLIVVPSSLVQNWKNEFTRWIGSHKVQPFIVDKNNRPKDFAKSHSPVLIISYEMFVKSHEDVKQSKFDLMICDEGHRLKNSNIRATCLLNGMSCTSRVLLTGTPIQNDLEEFYTLVDFVNPEILGSPTEFGRNFEKPILESKEPHCSPEALENGKIKSDELNQLTSEFILRRTQELIGKYLPQKTDYVVFCKATELQKKLYSMAVEYWTDRMDELGDREMPKHLSVITALKKICNHPFLMNNSSDDDLESLAKILKDKTRSQFMIQDSGKLIVVDSIMRSLLGTKERLILVSNFTQTLDVLVKVCLRNECNYLRFDGSTPVSQRNSIVSQFNNLNSPVQVLLLSSKAGGVGLNLIGGSRLILYDSDWNPATDLQAMARIWREGQTKNVHVYRLLTSGTIEEKIFQRQLKKTGLSENIVDSANANCVKLSKEELRDLFTFSTNDKCLTHDSLKCTCLGDGSIIDYPTSDDPDGSLCETSDERDCQIELKPSKAPTPLKMYQLLRWEHHQSPDTVVCITVHRCEPLRLKDLHKRPSIRVHLIDTKTRNYRRSAFGKNTVDLVQTQPFDHIQNRSVVPSWDEDLIIMEPASHVVAADCVLIFELLEAETDDVIAWAFLKPLAANGKQNVGSVLRLQLYKPLKSRAPKADEVHVPLAFVWYTKNKMSAYKSTLLVSLHSIDSQLVVRPVSPVAPSAVPSKNQSRRRSSQITSSPVNMKLSEAEKELIGVVWSRLPSLSCKLPNKINSSLPAGPDGGMSVSYSRSGLLVACHTSNTISIFTYRGSRYLILMGHHGLVYDLNWSPDDSFLLSSSADTTACVWNIKLKQTTPVAILSHPSYVYCGTWIGPSLAVTGCYDRALRLWDLAGVPTLLPQNTSVSSSSNTVKTATYDPLQCATSHGARINTLAVLSSDEILVSGDSDGVLIFWKLSTTLPRQLELSREVKLRELEGQVINKVSAHPGGKRILVASRDSKLRMVDLQSLSIIQWFHGGVNSKLQSGSCFCGCGSRVLSCSEDGSLSVWDANTGERIALYKGLHLPDSPATLTFHPKDNMFALVSHKVGTFPSLVLSLFSRDSSGTDIGVEWLDNRSEKFGSSSSVSDLSLQSSRESVAERPTRKKKKGILRALLQGGTKSKHKKGIANDAYTDTESGEGTATEANRTERRKRSAYRILETLGSDGEVNSRLTDIIKRMDNLIMTASPSRSQVY